MSCTERGVTWNDAEAVVNWWSGASVGDIAVAGRCRAQGNIELLRPRQDVGGVQRNRVTQTLLLPAL